MSLLGISKERQLFFNICAFFASLILVHTAYVFFITPSSAEVIYIANENNAPPSRTISVLLKDLEQEICLIIFTWSLLISGFIFFRTQEEIDFVFKSSSEEEIIKSVFKEGSSNFSSPSLIDNKIYAQQIDTSLLRFFSWAIPSIGFIGTVRGIGNALGKTGEALSGQISGMTESLGLAFNSTFVALFLTIFLMLIINLIEQKQDTLIIRLRSRILK